MTIDRSQMFVSLQMLCVLLNKSISNSLENWIRNIELAFGCWVFGPPLHTKNHPKPINLISINAFTRYVSSVCERGSLPFYHLPIRCCSMTESPTKIKDLSVRNCISWNLKNFTHREGRAAYLCIPSEQQSTTRKGLSATFQKKDIEG